MHPWHDVDPGNEVPEKVSAIIEIPRGSKIKYELDKKTGLIRVDEILHSSVHYPANYGFIPRTVGSDGDPLDVLVLGQESFLPLSIVLVRPLGLITISKDGECEGKLIAVHADDPEYEQYTSMKDLPPHRLKEIEQFFLDYKRLEDKDIEIKHVRGKKAAFKAIDRARKAYEEGRKEAA